MLTHPSTGVGTDAPCAASHSREDAAELVSAVAAGTARNMSDNGGDPNAGPTQRPNPPLTVQQMIDVLLTPGLTLYP